MESIKTALNPTLNSVDKIQPRLDSQIQNSEKNNESKAVPFSDLLQKNLDPSKADKAGPAGLKFSAHAKARIQSRGIELNTDDLIKMQEAIQKADKKGSKESLLLTDKAAFVVSVKNNTVITAVDRDSMKENVFTNIDSTIMI